MKRYKVSFGESTFEELDPKLVAKARKNINKHMMKVVRDYKYKQAISQMDAANTVICN